MSPDALDELEAWDRIERLDWGRDRDAIVGLLVVIANKLGAELDLATFVKVDESAGPGMMSPDEAVRVARRALGGC